jgi:DNA polymerase III epsilon subunit family exonuclease
MNLTIVGKENNFELDLSQQEFVVLDVETTSFTKTEFRIIEIALIVLKSDGTRLSTWHTLVNPECKVNFTKVHGLTDADVRTAPKFSEIADYLASQLTNRILVGHNISYDYGVIKYEFARIGVKIPSLPRICTLQMCYDLDLPFENVTLTTVRKELEIPEGLAHSALHDTAATTAVFASLLQLYFLRNVVEMRAFSGSVTNIDLTQTWMPPQLFEVEMLIKEREGISLASVADFPTTASDATLNKFTISKSSTELDVKIKTVCPKCGVGLVVTKNKYSGGQFKGCSKFPDCRFSENVEVLPT